MSSNLKRGSSSFGDVGCAGQWSEGGDVKKDQGSSFPHSKPAPLFGGAASRSTTASTSSQLHSKSSSSSDNASSHPAAKKSKLAPSVLKNPFEVLSSTAEEDCNTSDQNEASGSFKAASFLKPSKLDWGASSVFKTVQSNSLPPTSKPDSNSFSSQFLNLTRAPISGAIGNLNPAIGGELNGKSSNHGDSKNSICPPTKAEESALTSEEVPASNTSTGEESSRKVISESLFSVTPTSAATSSPNEGGSSSNDSSTGSKLFMFGQNLQDRVVVPAGVDSSKPEATEVSKEGDASGVENQSKKTITGAGGDLKPTPVFASSANEPFIFKEAGEKGSEKKGDNVFANAVQMQTGEENEITVLQMQARLFQYDSSLKNWRERGRGILKLNESKSAGNGKSANTFHNSARILMRTHATYQLVLNTKLFADQLLEKASDKALKLSCFNEENTGMSLYTIKGSGTDIDALFAHLKERIEKLKQTSQGYEQSSDEDQTRQESKRQQEGTANADEKKEETQTNCTTNFGTDDTSSGADSYYRSTTPSGHSLDENSRNTSPPLSSSEETNF